MILAWASPFKISRGYIIWVILKLNNKWKIHTDGKLHCNTVLDFHFITLDILEN